MQLGDALDELYLAGTRATYLSGELFLNDFLVVLSKLKCLS